MAKFSSLLNKPSTNVSINTFWININVLNAKVGLLQDSPKTMASTKTFLLCKNLLFLQLTPLLKDLQGANSIPMQITTIFQTLSQHGHNF